VISRRAGLFSENIALGCFLPSSLSFQYLQEDLLATHPGDFLAMETRE
jgi:hypothetical protein